MDDLDQLQQDLEKLLCTNAIRTRFFLGEYSQAEQKNGHVEKRGHDRVKSQLSFYISFYKNYHRYH